MTALVVFCFAMGPDKSCLLYASAAADERTRVDLVCSRNKKKLSNLREQLGDKHSFSVVDVTDDVVVAKWADESIDIFGAPDLLLNNAAVINRNKVLWELSAPEFDEVVFSSEIGVLQGPVRTQFGYHLLEVTSRDA